LASGLPHTLNQAAVMFKLSIVDTPRQRKLVLEGKLVAPWTAEVEPAWRRASKDLQGRSLIVDLRNVTLIGTDGETILLGLMRDGAEFLCGDVLAKHVVKQLARKCRCEG